MSKSDFRVGDCVWIGIYKLLPLLTVFTTKCDYDKRSHLLRLASPKTVPLTLVSGWPFKGVKAPAATWSAHRL